LLLLLQPLLQHLTLPLPLLQELTLALWQLAMLVSRIAALQRLL
jgi:hypothetical protein